ncbi:hypothetical protein Tco_0610366 [Tanacetum coccineum]
MSTSKTYQQSLADAGSETRPPMLERGSYIPWASRFRRYINRKRENRKWLNKALDEGPYQFEMFIPNNSTVSKLQTAEDLQGDALLHYDAEMELMNLILLSIPNDIYNSVMLSLRLRTLKRVDRVALVSVYNRFAQLMNDLERNDMHFLIVTINTKFLNSLQPECGKGHYARNCLKPRVRDSKYFMKQMLLAKQDEAGVILTDEQNDFLFADALRIEEIKELSAKICLMARIQPTDNTSDIGPSYDSALISEVQSSSNTENEEQMYPTHTKIINSTIGDDQINNDIIFDSPNRNFNSGSIEKDTHVPDLCALEKLARNAYQEAEKQQTFAQKVQKQNTTLNSQLELYKERVQVLENINEDNNYLNEFLEADKRAKHLSQQAQSQFVRD